LAKTQAVSTENTLAPDLKAVSAFDAAALDHIRQLRQPGRENPVIRMIDIYFIRTPELIAQMQDALACGDAEDFMAAAHSLKSNSAFVGAMRVSELSRRLEYMAKFDQWHAPKAVLALLKKEDRRAQEILEEEKKREESAP